MEMGGILRYKMRGLCPVNFPFLSANGAEKALQYELEAHCGISLWLKLLLKDNEPRTQLRPFKVQKPKPPSEQNNSEAWGLPQFRESALGVKRSFLELSEGSGFFSEQLSELRDDSYNAKSHSRNGIS